MNINPNWLSAIANIVVAGSIIIIFKQLKSDHDRSRRERAIELIGSWARNMKQGSTAARKLVETFSMEQAKSLFRQEPFDIESKYLNLLNAALEEDIDKGKADKICLNESISSELRWVVVSYLNNLEAILAAWRHNVADKNMIEEQFSYLVSQADGHYILEQFRKAAGGIDSYPATDEFVTHIKKSKDTKTAGKIKIAS